MVLKKSLPDRKGLETFKLSTLYHDFIKNDIAEDDGLFFHDAQFDVVVLEKKSCYILKLSVKFFYMLKRLRVV